MTSPNFEAWKCHFLHKCLTYVWLMSDLVWLMSDLCLCYMPIVASIESYHDGDDLSGGGFARFEDACFAFVLTGYIYHDS